MVEWFQSGGVMMWPLLLIGIGLVVLTVRSLMRARDGGTGVDNGLVSILFWGAMALVLGLLGTAVGFIQVGEAISRFGSVNPATLADGIGVALITLVFGLLLFILAMGCWYGVRHASGRSRLA